LKLDVTIPATDTLASEMGFTNANLDGYFSNHDIYFDTKVLSDKSGQIIDGVIKQVKEKIGINEVTFLPSYNQDLAFEDFQRNRNNIYNELLDAINISDKPKYIKSNIVYSLSYRLSWEPGVIIGESEYNPKNHAYNHHTLLFQHAKKFHRNKPSAIIFVNFPWFGEKISPMGNAKEIFYKNLCEDFFNGYENEPTKKGKMFNRKIHTEISAYDVTKHLSFILFIDDHSILRDANNKNMLKSFAYFSTNAINDISRSSFYSFLKSNTLILNDFVE